MTGNTASERLGEVLCDKHASSVISNAASFKQLSETKQELVMRQGKIDRTRLDAAEAVGTLFDKSQLVKSSAWLDEVLFIIVLVKFTRDTRLTRGGSFGQAKVNEPELIPLSLTHFRMLHDDVSRMQVHVDKMSRTVKMAEGLHQTIEQSVKTKHDDKTYSHDPDGRQQVCLSNLQQLRCHHQQPVFPEASIPCDL